MSLSHYRTAQASLPTAAQFHDRWGGAESLNAIEERSWTRLERAALWVTDRVGSMFFFGLIAAWTVLWLGWNSFGPAALRFDPGPVFAVWVFVSNVLQLHLLPLIMVGQNLQDRQTELRSELEFEVNRRAEAGVELMLAYLMQQHDLTLEILRRVERLEQPGDAQ